MSTEHDFDFVVVDKVHLTDLQSIFSVIVVAIAQLYIHSSADVRSLDSSQELCF